MHVLYSFCKGHIIIYEPSTFSSFKKIIKCFSLWSAHVCDFPLITYVVEPIQRRTKSPVKKQALNFSYPTIKVTLSPTSCFYKLLRVIF